MDVRAKQLLFKNLRGYFRLARSRFCPTSTPPLGISRKETKRQDCLFENPRRSAFSSKLREDKRRAKDNDTPNKSLDVRQKQLLFKKVLLNP